MQDAQLWKETFNVTGDLLKRSRTKNDNGNLAESKLSDWVIWEAYICSAVHLNDHR